MGHVPDPNVLGAPSLQSSPDLKLSQTPDQQNGGTAKAPQAATEQQEAPEPQTTLGTPNKVPEPEATPGTPNKVPEPGATPGTPNKVPEPKTSLDTPNKVPEPQTTLDTPKEPVSEAALDTPQEVPEATLNARQKVPEPKAQLRLKSKEAKQPVRSKARPRPPSIPPPQHLQAPHPMAGRGVVVPPPAKRARPCGVVEALENLCLAIHPIVIMLEHSRCHLRVRSSRWGRRT